MTRVRCNIPGRGFVPRTGTEIPEQLLPLSMWLLRRGGPSVAEKGGPNENACFCLQAVSSASVLPASVVIGTVTIGGIGIVVGMDTTAIPAAVT